MTNAETQKTQSAAGRQRITLGLILALFILRIPLVTGYRLLFTDPPGWVGPVFEIGTYLLLAVLLIWESDSLQDYHINDLAIWMIILFKPIETIYLSRWTDLNFPLAFPKIPSLFIWIIALGLLVRFRSRLFHKRAIQQQDLKWLLLGGLAGLAVVLITAYPFSFQIDPVNPGNRYPVLAVLMSGLVTIPYQIGYAAVSEEPVFRGFLWGYMRKAGWRDGWIWIFQAALFVFAHLYYLKTSLISLGFIVPLGALVLGWLAWRSRSIATSMVAHGVMNGLGYTLGYIVAVFLR